MSKKTKRQTSATVPPQTIPMSVRLTIEEREAINQAKYRIRRFSALLTAYSYVSGHGDGSPVEDDAQDAIGELMEVIYEAALKIDEAFSSADVRAHEGGA